MSVIPIHNSADLPEETVEFYRAGIHALLDAGVPFLVGGAYAMGRCTGIERHTKDFDIFVLPSDSRRALRTLARAGYRTELTFPHWLGKAYHSDDFIDVIFSSGNGIAVVDSEWFENAVPAEVLGIPLLLCPTEEIIWSKSFIAERERYDGADVAHLLLHCAGVLDWDRLLRRFGDRWRVLLSHLVLFGFIYPAQRTNIPARVLQELITRLEREMSSQPAEAPAVCQGTLLSREQYLIDVNQWGYRDARLTNDVRMNARDIQQWTDAIMNEKPHG
jgi:hypothetical protein